MALPKLVKGKRYVITGAAGSEEEKRFILKNEVKFPQTVEYNGECFLVKDESGISRWDSSYFTFKKYTRMPTVEIHKNRKGHYYTVKGANGKKLNHDYNSKRGCLNGIEALRRAMADFEIVDLTK